MTFEWQQPQTVEPRSYKCGYCDRLVGPNLGYWAAVKKSDGSSHSPLVIMICSHCKKPTFFDLNGVQHPGVAYANAVDALPQDIAGLYDEARRAYAAGAYTAAVLACRKILMNIAVAKGAAEGEPFIVYVKHLADTGYVPPDGKSVALYASEGSPRFDKAAVRWLARLALESDDLQLGDVQLAAAALQALPDRPDSALRVLPELSR